MLSSIISNDLFERVLRAPAGEGANELLVISGYATPAMVGRHFDSLRRQNLNVKLHLVLGMTARGGLEVDTHIGFKQLVEQDTNNRFKISYMHGNTDIHAKVYSWRRDGLAIRGFAGSANYSQVAFGLFGHETREEIMFNIDAKDAEEYFLDAANRSIDCIHDDVENKIRLFRKFDSDLYMPQDKSDFEYRDGAPVSAFESVKLSLLVSATGETHRVGGLNHGQRVGRDPNQAYLPIGVEVQRMGFFPPVDGQITVMTDDGKVLLMKRGGDGGKNLMTNQKNALLGQYFRDRLGLPSGSRVQRSDLDFYGRTDITFRKIDDETYLMDFSI